MSVSSFSCVSVVSIDDDDDVTVFVYVCRTDSHVGEHLFREAIQGALKDHARVLVTHQLQFLPFVDRVVVIGSGGAIVCQGSYQELTAQGIVFTSLASHGDVADVDEADEKADADMKVTAPSSSGGGVGDGLAVVPSVPPPMKRARSIEVVIGTPPATPEVTPGKADAASVPSMAIDRVIQDEERYVGVVGGSVYRAYLSAVGSKWYFVALVVLAAMLEATKTATLLWLTMWSDAESPDNTMYMSVYLALGVTTAVFVLMRNFMWFYGCYCASRKFHEAMVTAVLRAPVSWFNSTPQVRVVWMDA